MKETKTRTRTTTEDIDFIQSKPLTDKDRDAISDHIRKSKAAGKRSTRKASK